MAQIDAVLNEGKYESKDVFFQFLTGDNVDDTEEDYAPLDVPPEFRDIGAVELKVKISALWDKYTKDNPTY